MSDDGYSPEHEGSVPNAAPLASGGRDCNAHSNENCNVHTNGETPYASSETASSEPMSEDDEDRSTERSVNDGAAAICNVNSNSDDAGGDRANIVDFTAAVARRESRLLWNVHSNEFGELGVDRNEHSKGEADRSVVPNRETYPILQAAYDFLNDELFEGRLSNCVIALQHPRNSYAYFNEGRFCKKDGTRTDLIVLHSQHLALRPLKESLSTLAHEMCHLQQAHFGKKKPSRANYHNDEWAGMMTAIGLIPSDTGKEGGKRTGDRVSHYIEPGGRFAVAVAKLLASGFDIVWREVIEFDRSAAGPGGSGGGGPSLSGKRFKYSCPHPGCKLNAWAKPGAYLVCGAHNERMQPPPSGPGDAS
jgi:hypothetical protein